MAEVVQRHEGPSPKSLLVVLVILVVLVVLVVLVAPWGIGQGLFVPKLGHILMGERHHAPNLIYN